MHLRFLRFQISKNQKRVYCSKQCSNIGNTTHQECQCKTCGKSFFKQLNQFNKNGHNFCNHSCAASFTNKGQIKSQETKSKLRTASIKNESYKNLKPRDRGSDPLLREARSCPTCGEEFCILKKSPKTYCCKECFYKSGKLGGFRENSSQVHRCEYNGQKMDSGAEKLFAEILDLNGIKWLKNSTQFFEYTFSNKNKKILSRLFLAGIKSLGRN